MNIKLPHDHGHNLEEILKQMPDQSEFDILSDLFSLLGDSTRLKIFYLLCHCEECVINISSIMNMSSPAVSHHLRQLRLQSLIQSRREGKEVYYSAQLTPRVNILHETIERLFDIECPNVK